MAIWKKKKEEIKKGGDLPFDAVLAVKSLAQWSVEITALVVNWIVMRLESRTTFKGNRV